MKTKTKRIKAPSIATREEFERIVNEIATHSVEIRRKEAQRDESLQRTRAVFAPGLQQLSERRQLLALAAEKYAEEHREELLPGKAKSAETSLATFGFRTGMPTLKTLAKWTWEKVLAAITVAKREEFIRREPEVNKEALHAAHNAGERLEPLGVRVAQEESFFIEPKERGVS